MDREFIKPVVERLSAWQAETVERLRGGDQEALALKIALDTAVRWLEVCEQRQVPVGAEAVALPVPEDFAPLGEYRVMWDCETEDRGHWREVTRASPGDLLVKLS